MADEQKIVIDVKGVKITIEGKQSTHVEKKDEQLREDFNARKELIDSLIRAVGIYESAYVYIDDKDTAAELEKVISLSKEFLNNIAD
jgi:hypothetical protein